MVWATLACSSMFDNRAYPLRGQHRRARAVRCRQHRTPDEAHVSRSRGPAETAGSQCAGRSACACGYAWQWAEGIFPTDWRE